MSEVSEVREWVWLAGVEGQPRRRVVVLRQADLPGFYLVRLVEDLPGAEPLLVAYSRLALAQGDE